MTAGGHDAVIGGGNEVNIAKGCPRKNYKNRSFYKEGEYSGMKLILEGPLLHELEVVVK